jgi:hypothetical protein
MKQQERLRTITVKRTVTQIEKQCPVCHRTFWGAKISLYCGRPCRNRADYERHNEERNTTRVEKYHEQRATGTK